MTKSNVSEIKAIDSYLIYNNELCYFKDGTFFVHNESYYLSIDSNCSKIIFVNESFYLSFSNGKLYRFNKNNLYQNLDIESSIDTIFDNQFITIYDSKEYDYENWRASKNLYHLMDEKSLLKNNIFGNLFFYNNEIYVNDLVNIKKITPQLEEIWQFNLTNFDTNSSQKSGNFKKFLGIVADNLFILSEENAIIVLNTMDGTLVKLIYDKNFPGMENAFIHPENFNIYCLSDAFVKINSRTLEIETLKKITREKTSPDINTLLYGIKDSSYQDKYISFTSYTSFKSGLAKWIGLFDYHTEEIVWHYELLEENSPLTIPAFEFPQLAGNKLYVLDNEKTLHILELKD